MPNGQRPLYNVRNNTYLAWRGRGGLSQPRNWITASPTRSWEYGTISTRIRSRSCH